mgnify:FL=1
MAGFWEGLGGLLGGAGSYYLGKENIAGAKQLGLDTQAGADLLAEQARAGTEFKPYTVTSGLGNVGTTAEGGFNINLSPEQEALQSQLMGQAAGLFGQVGQDPAAQQAAIYEQLRATQRPEEQRQRLATEERMLSQGRLGMQSSAYGGASPELLAQETARQEAMGRANIGARQQALSEQQQALAGGQGLLNAGYSPQQQALAMLQSSSVPAGFADIGRRSGTEFSSQLGLGGLESRLGAEDLANRLQLQQGQGALDTIFGQQATPLEQAQIAEIYAKMGGNPNSGGLWGAIFSDSRLKENIETIGKDTRTGLTLYNFSYIADPSSVIYEGVMAQEVLDYMPEAVTTASNGYYAVNYEMLNLEMKEAEVA